MRIPKSFLFYFFILFQVSLFAQTNNNFVSLKNFTPPSPEAAALGRYGEIPVSLSTGIPEISIPVYEIKSKKLSLPVSLSYHASGIKVEDIATPVGLGWVLNSGGAISRTVVGVADERGNGLLSISDPDTLYKDKSRLEGVLYNESDYYNLISLANGVFDVHSDVYNINIPGVSGKFVYDINKQVHYTPVDKQLKITRNPNNTFTVTDDEGVKYFFNDTEKTENEQTGGLQDITSWNLTMMLSADLSDTIIFKYKAAEPFEDIFFSYSFYVNAFHDESVTPPCSMAAANFNWTPQVSTYQYDRKLIDTIKFSNGYAKFEYANDRQDPVKERLSKIKIYNAAGLVKEVELMHSYFISGQNPVEYEKYAKRLKLDKVKFNDKASLAVNSYSFEYNQILLPAYWTYEGGAKRSTAIDYWGYYTGGGGAKTLLPKNYRNYIEQFLIRFYGITNTSLLNAYEQWAADRYPNPAYTQACILNKIVYPTGAYSIFQYENNKRGYTTNDKELKGGLRVSRIIAFDSISNNVHVKSYAYNEGSEISMLYPDDFYYSVSAISRSEPDKSSGYCQGGSFYIYSNPTVPFNYFGGSPMFYTNVTEYDGFPGDNNGKTEYTFYSEPDSLYGLDLNKYWNFSTDKSWARGQLLNKKVFKWENNNYTLLKETKNQYATLGRKVVKIGQVCEQMTVTRGVSLDVYLNEVTTPYYHKIMLHYFDYVDVSLSLGAKMLTKTEETDYANGSIIKRQEFFYNNPGHLYPTKITSASSKTNEIVSEVRKYPQDKSGILNLTATAAAAIDGMVNQHILSIPIETDYFRNTNLTYRNRTDFKNWNNSNKFYKDIVYQQTGAGALEPRIQYKSYDGNGNPTTLQYVNGHPVSYIWDYNKSLPTASVINANDNEVAYTSFETEGGGNWSVNAGTIVTGGFTGTKSYSLTNGNVAKSNLNSSKDYIVTYWSKNGTALVNGMAGQTVNAKSGWTLYEHALEKPATITVSGGVTLDELRLYPKDAQMNSYTYTPLVGLISSCTPNNVVTFYEYDNYGRLNRLLDQDKKIIKQFDYKYKDPNNTSAAGNWRATGNLRSATGIGGRITGISEQEMKDYNTASATYNQTVWVPLGTSGPIKESWVATGQKRCEKDSRGSNIGREESEFEDTNPYSYSYKQKTWMPTGTSGNCPPPCDREGQKIINGVCETSLKVYTSRVEVVLPDGNIQCDSMYHYEWSDGSRSGDYQELIPGECPADS